jgi:hypothetical protein
VIRRLAVALAALLAAAYWYVDAQTIGERCDAEQPAGTAGHRYEWGWLPPAYVCVYSDRAGGEVTRRRPGPWRP